MREFGNAPVVHVAFVPDASHKQGAACTSWVPHMQIHAAPDRRQQAGSIKVISSKTYYSEVGFWETTRNYSGLKRLVSGKRPPKVITTSVKKPSKCSLGPKKRNPRPLLKAVGLPMIGALLPLAHAWQALQDDISRCMAL